MTPTELKRGSNFTQPIFTDEEKKGKIHQKILYRIAKLMLLGKFGRASRLASREFGTSPKFFSLEVRLKWAEDYIAVYERAHGIKEDRKEINEHLEKMKQEAAEITMTEKDFHGDTEGIKINIHKPSKDDDGFVKLV